MHLQSFFFSDIFFLLTHSFAVLQDITAFHHIDAGSSFILTGWLSFS